MEVIATNKKIALFEGWTFNVRSDNTVVVRFDGVQKYTEHEKNLDIPLLTFHNYHSSWDKLMPVCRKIINLYGDKREDIFSALHRCDIYKVYHAVSDFIDFWYDETQPKMRWRDVKFPYSPKPKGKIIKPHGNPCN